MHEQKTPDIDMGTLATGCATGCGTGCLQVLIIAAVVVGSGLQVRQNSPIPLSFQFLGFITTGAAALITGYVTARKAPHSQMLHALIVGALGVLLGIVATVFNPNGGNKTLFNLLGFLCYVPLTCLGAQWAISSAEPEAPARSEVDLDDIKPNDLV